MSEQLPEPLVPANGDLRHYEFMPLHIERLRRSKTWMLAKRDPALAFYLINLWTASWHEVPAGSLEDDDEILAGLAICDIRRFSRIKGDLLHGWVKCNDGRLYHPVVAELANAALKSRKSLSLRGSQGAAKRWHGHSSANGQPMANDGKEIEEKEYTPQTPQGGPSRKRRGEEVDPRLPVEHPWEQRLRYWAQGKKWNPFDGPEPGQPGCGAPPELADAATKQRHRSLNGAAP